MVRHHLAKLHPAEHQLQELVALTHDYTSAEVRLFYKLHLVSINDDIIRKMAGLRLRVCPEGLTSAEVIILKLPGSAAPHNRADKKYII